MIGIRPERPGDVATVVVLGPPGYYPRFSLSPDIWPVACLARESSARRPKRRPFPLRAKPHTLSGAKTTRIAIFRCGIFDILPWPVKRP